MTETTPRLTLPLLAPGQAQKELFHNEALLLLDAATHPVAATIGDAAPPASPAVGGCWIVGATPTGDWAGQALRLAAWTGGGWRFVALPTGAMVWIEAEQAYAIRTPGGWQIGDLPARRVVIGGLAVLGAQQPAIAAPAAGATIDAEARSAIATILLTLRNHGLIAS